ncbi:MULTISPECIES: capsular biosynthesis protein [unclassified Campylobacter]|uniref:capsular biosynthesis protein n=1 Tax=unclassified Campylobacter TaxID=2593542 RepID=UPI001D66FAAD|nr:capsular biosynthesis protein [Campylobacter sp. RM9331]MBZ8005878.1 capsular biosynthesis protein [Campylobacter sp. RM9332]
MKESMNINSLISKFNNENILFLQGPLGPFFKRFSKYLNKNNKIYKINFTAGDFIFYPSKYNYKGSLNNLKSYLDNFYKLNKITCIILFGDTRPIHEIAINLAKKLNIKIYVFEEGYLRPNYITCEMTGVNANSLMSKNKNDYKKLNTYKENSKLFKSSFKIMAFYALMYYTFSIIFQVFYNNKNYHRPLNIMELFRWFRHFYRKAKYSILEKNVDNLAKKYSKKYFLAVLQVHNDSQIKKHFKDKGMKKFIVKTIKSFAKNRANNNVLIFKHHPLDIAYTDYSNIINELTKRLGISDKVFYIHRGNIPNLLKNAKGCICINSTVGMQALYHNCPTIVLGNAIYNIDGLVYKNDLDSFWQNAHNFVSDYDLYLKFQGYLLKNNQYNANFYLNFKEFEIGN